MCNNEGIDAKGIRADTENDTDFGMSHTHSGTADITIDGL